MEDKFCIGITEDFTKSYVDVVVENTRNYEKVFEQTVLKEELDSLFLELKKKYPNSYKCTYRL